MVFSERGNGIRCVYCKRRAAGHRETTAFIARAEAVEVLAFVQFAFVYSWGCFAPLKGGLGFHFIIENSEVVLKAMVKMV